jgi:flavin-dependent dehydrogenase
MQEYDVIVVGGGPAGTTAATLLTKAGRKVLLLEKDRFPGIGDPGRPRLAAPLRHEGEPLDAEPG